ncbi:protein kintoun isoform X2 [Pimephales promelas]|uniref:protein kintoun isoform X2 n=1 Tax=Pimephales promelas TaxID=90988 RepID=UPI00195570BC|nr:protein kintoun isoform X2 [Pimephales promelas]
MDMGSKLEELNLTRDEMNRFGKALKDEKFRELLLEYAAEISDPENRRRYEEEITQMEEERGNSVQFIHPEANHVLKTRSARGKCFINICSNPRIGKPSCEAARDRDGEPGQNWRLPFSLTPGRADRDAAGNGCEVYDIVFHPDALHMAAKNARFMKLIHSTAIGGIEDSFHIKMDREQVKQLKMKYKGVAHPAVIRRPIPGHHQTNRSSGEDVLSFPYPDENQTAPEKEPEASQSPCNPDDIRSKQPIKPHYTVKYRSVVDLQDYRCSRDSGPGARPREIVVIIDVPLLGSALEAEVCVTERRLILEAPEPAYRLDLPLAYPVDEEKGDAKFNKTKKQLTITLPVRPAKTLELRVSCDEAKSDVNEEADQNTKEDGLHPDHTEGLAPDHIGGGLDPDHTEGLAPDHIGGCLDLDHIGAGLDPDHTEVLASDHIGGGLDPDHTEGHYSDHIEGGLDPDHKGGGLDPDHTGGGLDPDHTEGLAPDHIEGGLDPDHTGLASDHVVGGLDLDHTEGLAPDHTGGGLDPDHTGLASDHIGGGLDPDHTGGLDPYHTGGGLDPDHTGGGLAPDHTGGGLDPDHTGGGLDPDHTGLSSDHIGGGLDPDHTGGLDPDHTGGGLDPDHIEGLALDHTESERSQPSCDTEFEPQFTDLTRDRQTHVMSNHLIINPTENRTEPDRSVEDETNTNRAVESLSETGFVRESHRLHSRDEEAENTSLQTNDNTLIHQPTSSSVTEQEDPNSTREAEGPESKRSSGDCGSDGDAGIRSEDPVLRETSHVTSATLRFQNTLRFDLD